MTRGSCRERTKAMRAIVIIQQMTRRNVMVGRVVAELRERLGLSKATAYRYIADACDVLGLHVELPPPSERNLGSGWRAERIVVERAP